MTPIRSVSECVLCAIGVLRQVSSACSWCSVVLLLLLLFPFRD